MTTKTQASDEATAAEETTANRAATSVSESDMALADQFRERFNATEGERHVGRENAEFCLVNAANTMALVHTGEVDRLRGVSSDAILEDFEPADADLELVKRGRIGLTAHYELRHRRGTSLYAAKYLIPVAQFFETPVAEFSLSTHDDGHFGSFLLRIDFEGTPWVVVVAPALT